MKLLMFTFGFKVQLPLNDFEKGIQDLLDSKNLAVNASKNFNPRLSKNSKLQTIKKTLQ